METGKKDWIKPELIIMVRNKPEEAVLSFCKVLEEYGPDDGADPDGGEYYVCSGNLGTCLEPSPS